MLNSKQFNNCIDVDEVEMANGDVEPLFFVKQVNEVGHAQKSNLSRSNTESK